MPAFRYYIDNFLDDKEVVLKDLEHQHLLKVMRQREGEQVELVNGKGALATATISSIAKKETRLLIESFKSFPLKYKITLLQALPLPQHLELIAEKGCELGMTELVLFQGDKSSAHFSEQKLKRLQMKLIAALKQSGRLYLPTIKWIPNLEEVGVEADFLCYGDIQNLAPPLFKALPLKNLAESFCFCSGPESGFSQKEADYLQKNKFLGISLHSNVLRAETAPLAFLALMHHYLNLQGNVSIIN